jgi:hypothetical protein
MCLPKFTSHPDEKKDLESALLACLKGVGLTVHVVDGMFDLLVVSPRGHVDSYLEIKVRLKGHSKSCPISPAQWSFLSGHVAPSRMESNLRVLIYDHEAKLYALATASQIKGGIQASQPSSTSYISASCLGGLPWGDECVTEKSLMAWIYR